MLFCCWLITYVYYRPLSYNSGLQVDQCLFLVLTMYPRRLTPQLLPLSRAEFPLFELEKFNFRLNLKYTPSRISPLSGKYLVQPSGRMMGIVVEGVVGGWGGGGVLGGEGSGHFWGQFPHFWSPASLRNPIYLLLNPTTWQLDTWRIALGELGALYIREQRRYF